MKTTIALIMSIIKGKVVIFSFFGAISFFQFKKKGWSYVTFCVNLEWWLAAMANESTSSVVRAILSIIHENELLPSNHCAVLLMKSTYSGEFKSHERASCCQLISVNMTATIFNMTTHGPCMREHFFAQNAAMALITLAAYIIKSITIMIKYSFL